MAKSILLTVCRQKLLRENWKTDLYGEAFASFVNELKGEYSRYSIDITSAFNDNVEVTVNSYADTLNAVRITSADDGFYNKCIGHIIGQSKNLDLFEDIRSAVSRVAFAPEMIQPDDSHRKVCHNCGCGC